MTITSAQSSGLAALAAAGVGAALLVIEEIATAVRDREPVIHYWPVWLALWGALMSSGALACVLIVTFADAPGRTPGLIAIYLGLTAATGWIVGHARSQEIERRKKTFDLLIKLRESDALTTRLTTILDHFPPGRIVTPEALSVLGADVDRKVRTAIYYIANYYEFVALSIRSGDLDLQTFFESYRLMIIAFEQKCSPVLNQIRVKNAEKKTKAYEGLSWLVETFERLGHGRPILAPEAPPRTSALPG